jgi:hypothetical protein
MLFARVVPFRPVVPTLGESLFGPDLMDSLSDARDDFL